MSSAPTSPSSDLQQLCELGQEQLMRMEYLTAERTLERAEIIAWTNRDFVALSDVLSYECGAMSDQWIDAIGAMRSAIE